MLLTGLVVEIALIPFALYHFHRAGLYGVAANMVAIPLTTFVIMPLEAGALLLDIGRAGRAALVGDGLGDRCAALARPHGRRRPRARWRCCRPCRAGRSR